MPVTPPLTYQTASSLFYGSLDFRISKSQSQDAWKNTLFIPLLATLLSGGILVFQWILTASSTTTKLHNSLCGHPYSGRFVKLKKYADEHGGPVILTFKIDRLLGSASLLGLSLFDLLDALRDTDSGAGAILESGNWPKLALITTFLYTSILSAFSLIPNGWMQTLTRHTNFVLFAAFATYVYRDVWSFATFTEFPVDDVSPLLWAKIGILTFTGVLIPLFVPRKYVPVDPEHPMEVPNPEQTASVFSLAVYTFLDSIILDAYKVPHLSHEKLPPFCDYDYSTRLTVNAFPSLDPFRGASKTRHFFWCVLQVFFWEYLVMALCLVGQVLANFVSPLALNRILNYLETPNSNAYVRPWFWVFCLFCGPMLNSFFFQWYYYTATFALTRVQAILTALIFEHSLRTRVKAEASGESSRPGTGAVTPAETPEPLSVEESSTVKEANTEESRRSTALSLNTLVDGSGDAESSGTSTPKKGEAAEPSKPKTDLGQPKQPKKKSNLIGKINTLATVDVDKIAEAKDFLMVFFLVPLELTLSCIFLYAVLGWSALIGLASVILMLPLPGYIASKIQKINKEQMEKTDARVEGVTQTIGVLRMVKLFGWEQKMSQKMKDAREEELKWLFRDKIFSLVNDVINFCIPTLTMLLTFATHTVIARQALTPSKIFSSAAVFEIVRSLLHRTSWIFTTMIRGKVSLERVSQFLRETELLDTYSEETYTEVNTLPSLPSGEDKTIGFHDATFAWSKEAEDGTKTPSSRSFRLKVPGRVEFKPGMLNLIVGPTGSGKTSILMALLGEMHFMPSTVDSWFNLPRAGGVAYAAQESWVQNESIRDNILFGSQYNEERYEKVLHQCALEQDLKLFEAGDKTEVGEKGLTLSGGQKARVTLARAVYSSAQILLFDDVLAALDVHTSKHIVRECLEGDLLRGRTVLLVTHNVALVSPIAGHIVAVGLDGVAREVSDISEVLESDKILASEVEKEDDKAEVETETIDSDNKKDEKEADGKLILAEEIEVGHVSWKAIKLYLKGLGGDAPIFFLTIWLVGTVLVEACNMFAVWFLGYWGTQYETHDPSEVATSHYLGGYSAILLACVVIYNVVNTVYIFGSQNASRFVNSQLIDSILGSTFRWLDETPASRIVARCTQDIAVVDTPLSFAFNLVVSLAAAMVVKLAGPVFFSPIFLVPGVLVAVLGIYLANIYLKAQMSVKREMSNARAPVLAHFGAAIAGLVSIRAYGAQEAFKKESLRRIDHFTNLSRVSYNLNRWIGIRIDLLGATFTAALASYLLITRKINAANTGFSLNMSLEFCAMVLWLVRWYNEFEVKANSLERIQSYLEIDHELKPTETGKPPAAWPKSGDLQVDHLTSRYSATGPKVLHDVTFHAKSGERIGIVGRTGSGKSSLTLSLLRCILTEGVVYFDGIATKDINLDALRSNITIIPQVPELLSGTLRRNLDPFEQHDDAVLNAALHSSGLFALQNESDDARLTLDSDISSGGNNLSVGQRQIIALARAMVRNSKLLILDEATSAIDHKTDSIIQATLRNELGPDTTVLTIAHRLQTIMDADKIMVLDSGKIVEYDTPQVLLHKKGGLFRALVDGSGDRKALYAAAQQKAGQSNSG